MFRALAVCIILFAATALYGNPAWSGWWDKKKADTAPLPPLRRSKAALDKKKAGAASSASKPNLARYLQLDRTQEKKIVAALFAYGKSRQLKKSRLQTAELDFKALFTAASPDTAKIDAKFREISGLQADLRFDEIRKLRYVRTILNDDQLRKFKKVIYEGFMR